METSSTLQVIYSLAQVPAAQSQLPHLPPFSFAQVPELHHMPENASPVNMDSRESNHDGGLSYAGLINDVVLDKRLQSRRS